MTAMTAPLAQHLTQERQRLVAHYQKKQQPQSFFQAWERVLDETLIRLWQEYPLDNVCLLAIGGYGRGEMYPYSDLDLALVADHPFTDEEETAAHAFIQNLWDIGLAPAPKMGGLRQMLDASAADLTSETALLEARFICGPHQVADELSRLLFLQRDLATFIEGKMAEQQARHTKSQGAASQLEPNIKTCQGGLRDIHALIWLMKAQGLHVSFQELVDERILTRTEAGRLMHSHRQLARLRMALHAVCARAEERLIFDVQTPVAEFMGLKSDRYSRASEKLMRLLYRTTKSINQLDGILLPMLKARVFRDWPRVVRQLNHQYYQVGNFLAVRDKSLFRRQPQALFQILDTAQHSQNNVQIAPETLRAWWGAAQHVGRDFYADPVNRERFIGFFKQGRGLTRILRFLNLYGLLGRYLPGFGKIVGLLQHDLFHIYPVDDHILMVVRNMRRLAVAEHNHELPLASGLMEHFDKPYILYLAAFFHDIAKGRGGNHAHLGMDDARQFGQDHFMPPEDTDLLVWLVQEHLTMSITSQKEDIQDPEVVARFCQKVNSPERLIALYLLTVCDIRGTNPKIWSNWKANLLETLFHSALHHLSSAAAPNRHVLALSRQEAALNALEALGATQNEQRRIWQLLGTTYFVRHQAEEILWHMQKLYGRWHESQAHIRLLPRTSTLQLLVYMPNRDKLLAQLAQIIGRQQLSILTARIFVTAHDYILDTFILGIPATFSENDYARLAQFLQKHLDDFLGGRNEDIRQIKAATRRTRHLPITPQIRIVQEDDERSSLFVLSIVAANRNGLLANILAVLSDLNLSILYAQITTLDERVEDSFLLHSSKLGDARVQRALQEALMRQLA